ncbi:MAG: MarR family transcriptional regulator [Actinomycetales bacterium]|nr:MarR family transcriptional regulator [Actinomycetales bacterium]
MGETRWLTDDEQTIWRSYLDVIRLVTERLQRQLLEDSGLSLPEYDVLVHLSEVGGRCMRMSELADLVVNSRSRLTHTIARMERRGLVRREPCPEDGRGVLCRLTEEGYAVLEKAAPGHVEEVRTTIFDAIDESDIAALGLAMDKLRVHLRES